MQIVRGYLLSHHHHCAFPSFTSHLPATTSYQIRVNTQQHLSPATISVQSWRTSAHGLLHRRPRRNAPAGRPSTSLSVRSSQTRMETTALLSRYGSKP
jgi:hypothetical protein